MSPSRSPRRNGSARRRTRTRLWKKSVERASSLPVRRISKSASVGLLAKGLAALLALIIFVLISSFRFYMIDRQRNGSELGEEFKVLGSTGNVRSFV